MYCIRILLERTATLLDTSLEMSLALGYFYLGRLLVDSPFRENEIHRNSIVGLSSAEVGFCYGFCSVKAYNFFELSNARADYSFRL